MKKIYIYSLLGFILLLGSCDKFLNVEPKDSLSGNNFWRDENDAEAFTRDVYRLLRIGLGTSKAMMLMADMRSAPVTSTAYPPRGDFDLLASNDLKALVGTERRQGDITTWWQAYAEWDTFSDWGEIYKIVQAANALYDKADELAEVNVSPQTIKKYKAEAVFVRCLTYFYLFRIFGDVPYYTNAYNEEALGRTSHLQVAKNCLVELTQIKDDLPWTYDDPANRGVRAMRGSAIALMMHLNMWLAGFDESNRVNYYQDVDMLGDELTNQGEIASNAYELLPIDDIGDVFAGRSKEGLFEMPQNVNYGDQLGNRMKVIYTSVLHYPYFNQHQDPTRSEVAWYPNYLAMLYPEGVADGRIDMWFDENMMSGSGTFNFFKYFNFAFGMANTPSSISNYFMVFRYADAILLQAEANAELGIDDKAAVLLNRIRSRANTGLYPAVNSYDNNIADAIYWERCKELMGEGHYFYDLVRTRKIYNPDYCYRPMTFSAFNAGAWTWPINPNAFVKNPYMTNNNYWN